MASSSLKKVATRVMGTPALAEGIRSYFGVSGSVVAKVLDARERVCELVEDAPSNDYRSADHRAGEFCYLAAQTEQALYRSNRLAESISDNELWPLASLFASARAAHWNEPNTNLSRVKQTTVLQDKMINTAFHVSGMLLPNAVIGRYDIGQRESVEAYLELNIRLFNENGGELGLPRDGQYNLQTLLAHVTDKRCFTGLHVPQIERMYCEQQQNNFYDLKSMMDNPAMSTLVVATGQTEWTKAIASGRPIAGLRAQFGVNFSPLMRDLA